MTAESPIRVEQLTAREREVAQAVSRGLRNRAIARQFGISEETVKKHLVNIYGKLAIDGRVQLAIHLLRGADPLMPMSVPSGGGVRHHANEVGVGPHAREIDNNRIFGGIIASERRG